jgi:hypothetical protein|tara:strand:+ start:595 stop:888 length:294 start_codon:yes stop_codon:yes gene_type:complete
MAQTRVHGFTEDLNAFGRQMHVATATVSTNMTQAKMDALIAAITVQNYTITGVEGFVVDVATAVHVAYEGGPAIADDSSDALGVTGCAWAAVVSFAG